MSGLALPWNGGDALITLLAMKDYLASRLPAVCGHLTNCHVDAIEMVHESDPVKKSDITKKTIQRLKAVLPDLDFLGLKFTKLAVERAIPEVMGWDDTQLTSGIGLIEERMSDELAQFHLLYLSQQERDFYRKPELFGSQFKTAFPAANLEITEAGSCFALGRYTASVFHLMRAVESGLESLYVGVGLPKPPKTTWSWHTVLTDIEKKIKANDQAGDAAWKSKSSFYKNAHGFLFAIKQPLRNETMHLETSYGENEATRVFDAVRSFLTHIATELKEVT